MFNQRYRAYLKATGTDPSKVRGYQYKIWLDGMWAEFMEEKGINIYFNLDEEYDSEFDNWLEKKFKNTDDGMNYIDKKGNEIFVSAGLGMKEYGSFRKSEAGGLHRVKSPSMPMASSREEAQKNLDLWARKNGLKVVEEVKKMFNAEEVKGFNKLNDADKELFKKFCKKFYDAWEYPEKHKPVKVQKMKGYLKVTLIDVSWVHITKDCEWY